MHHYISNFCINQASWAAVAGVCEFTDEVTWIRQVTILSTSPLTLPEHDQFLDPFLKLDTQHHIIISDEFFLISTVGLLTLFWEGGGIN